jgi:hypothetical protein
VTRRFGKLALLLGVLGLAVVLAWRLISVPRHPVALIRVVDQAGKPVAGAIVKPDGLRSKPGVYNSGHYGWGNPDWPPSLPVTTDAQGRAEVPYPKYVMERIETGEISFSVEHPDYVPDRPFRVVDTRPPRGAPWRVWWSYVGSWLRLKGAVAQTGPVILQKGGTLLISVRPGSSAAGNPPLFAQVSGDTQIKPDSWRRPQAGVLVTGQLGPGPRLVRAVLFDGQGMTWFSEVMAISAAAGVTNELIVDLKPGVKVRGRVDDNVPRPVTHGRVIAQVWPSGAEAKASPPQWHTWAEIGADGTFEIGPLPAGDLEIVAVCDGFVSTNGPGQSKSMRYPQKHVLETNDLQLTMGMEPTGSLEVLVMDETGKALKDVVVSAWPNVRYGEWSATILGGDCYQTADFLKEEPARYHLLQQPVRGFSATSDVSGLALLFNLPMETTSFAAVHPRYVLPAVTGGAGGKSRHATFVLAAGLTNHAQVRLEPKERAPIAHY